MMEHTRKRQNTKSFRYDNKCPLKIHTIFPKHGTGAKIWSLAQIAKNSYHQ